MAARKAGARMIVLVLAVFVAFGVSVVVPQTKAPPAKVQDAGPKNSVPLDVLVKAPLPLPVTVVNTDTGPGLPQGFVPGSVWRYYPNMSAPASAITTFAVKQVQPSGWALLEPRPATSPSAFWCYVPGLGGFWGQ
jgi:hypothetical protein